MNVLLDERVLRKGSDVKYAFIQRHRHVGPISVQCRVLGVSVAGYHAHFVRRASAEQRRHSSKQTRLLFHSDRDSQYASKDYRDALTEYGITPSMRRRGDCWDNACSETLFGSLKVEPLHGQRFKTRRQAMDEVIASLVQRSRASGVANRHRIRRKPA